MAEKMKVDGQRHCGRVRYAAIIDPNNVSVCTHAAAAHLDDRYFL